MVGRAKVSTNGRRRKPVGPAPDDVDDSELDGDEPVEASSREADDEVDVEVEGDDTDNVGEQSVEINVQDLLAQLEAETRGGGKTSACARRRLEDYLEEKRIARALQDMDEFDI